MANAVEKITEHKPTSTAITPAEMIGQAIQSGSGPEVMEKLMALQERWDAHQARKAFDNAIAEAKSEIPPIVKNAEVDFTSQKGRTNYRHETLDGIARVVEPILSKHGLSYRFRSRQEGQQLHVTCIVAHRDGHSEETTLSGPPDQSGSKNAYQAIGSAATYLQRYTLKLALGLSAAHDDDGSTAAPRHDAPAPEPKPKSKARNDYSNFQERIRYAQSEGELKRIWGEIEKSGMPEDWVKDLIAEINDALAEIRPGGAPKVTATQTLDDQFPGDLPEETIEAAKNLTAG